MEKTNRIRMTKSTILVCLFVLLAITIVACTTNTIAEDGNVVYGYGNSWVGDGGQRDSSGQNRDAQSLSLVKALVEANMGTLGPLAPSEPTAIFIDPDGVARAENSVENSVESRLSIGSVLPLVRTRADILDVYQELDHDFEIMIEDANDWLVIVNQDGAPAFFYVVEDRGNNDFVVAEGWSGAEGFDDGLAYFREMFPDDDVRIYYGNRWYYFLSADYSTLIEVPPQPIDSEWFRERRGGYVETMDTEVVAEIIREEVERADLIRQGLAEVQYGGICLVEEYRRRRGS